MATLQLPQALRRRECGSIQHVAGRNARCPVLLVHGYAASDVRELIRTETFAHADAAAPAGASLEPMAARCCPP